MPADNSTAVPEESATQKSLLKRLFGIYEIILMVLILLSIIGIGITDFSPGDSHRYWFAMVPVFAGACLILEWSRARGKGRLVILLLLALTTFFAGIHLGWRLFIVGIFLGVALIGAAFLEEFVWMFLILAIVVVAIFLLLKRYVGT
jgi:hypothetical protein